MTKNLDKLSKRAISNLCSISITFAIQVNFLQE